MKRSLFHLLFIVIWPTLSNLYACRKDSFELISCARWKIDENGRAVLFLSIIMTENLIKLYATTLLAGHFSDRNCRNGCGPFLIMRHLFEVIRFLEHPLSSVESMVHIGLWRYSSPFALYLLLFFIFQKVAVQQYGSVKL